MRLLIPRLHFQKPGSLLDFRKEKVEHWRSGSRHSITGQVLPAVGEIQGCLSRLPGSENIKEVFNYGVKRRGEITDLGAPYQPSKVLGGWEEE